MSKHYYDFYEMRTGRSRRRQSAYGPHGLWMDPQQTNSKQSHPYSYSEFFIFGDHKSIEGCSADYSDRYLQWGQQKFDEACAAVGKRKRWDQMSPSELDTFVKAYHGAEYTATGLAEGCNASSGYPYYIIFYKKEQ